MRLLITLAIVAIANLLVGEAKDAEVVVGRQIYGVQDAIRELNLFQRHSDKNFEEKCERYAVLLSSLKKYTFDQFWVADLALVKRDEIRKRYRMIDVETLRNLYIEAIEKYMSSIAEKPMLDLVKCLDKFRRFDAKARSYLERKDLVATISQYKSLIDQPLKFLVDKEQRLHDVKVNELQPAVFAALKSMLGEDPLIVEEETTTPVPEVIEENLVEESVSSNDVTPGEQEDLNQLSEEEWNYVNKVITTMRTVYESLPAESQLVDRCASYSKVAEIESEKDLNEQFIGKVITEAARESKTVKPEGAAFKPDADKRHSFLVFTDLIDPRAEGNSGVWLDLMDCIAQWVEIDEDAKRMVLDPENNKALEEILGTGPQQDQKQQHLQQEPLVEVSTVVATPKAGQASETPKAAKKTANPAKVAAEKPTKAPEVTVAPAPENQEGSVDEMHYVDKIASLLTRVYETLPLETGLDDRCRTYSKLIDADPIAVNEKLADSLVDQTGKSLKATPKAPNAFDLKGESVENFLIILQALELSQNDFAVWIDMMDCAAQLENGNDAIRDFLSQPGRKALLEEVMKSTAVEEEVATAKPATTNENKQVAKSA